MGRWRGWVTDSKMLLLACVASCILLCCPVSDLDVSYKYWLIFIFCSVPFHRTNLDLPCPFPSDSLLSKNPIHSSRPNSNASSVEKLCPKPTRHNLSCSPPCSLSTLFILLSQHLSCFTMLGFICAALCLWLMNFLGMGTISHLVVGFSVSSISSAHGRWTSLTWMAQRGG